MNRSTPGLPIRQLPDEKYVCRSRSNWTWFQFGTGHGTDWFQIGKQVHQGCILSPCLFNLYAEYIMRNAGLDEASITLDEAGIKTVRRNINNLRYADDTTLMAESDHWTGISVSGQSLSPEQCLWAPRASSDPACFSPQGGASAGSQARRGLLPHYRSSLKKFLKRSLVFPVLLFSSISLH